MRKPAFCICENKGADQLRDKQETDQRLCFHYFVFATYIVNPKFQAASHLLWLYSPLCGTWSETLKTGFLMMRLK